MYLIFTIVAIIIIIWIVGKTGQWWGNVAIGTASAISENAKENAPKNIAVFKTKIHERYGFLGVDSYSFESKLKEEPMDFRRQLNTYTHGRAKIISEEKQENGETIFKVSISNGDLSTVNKMVCNEHSSFNKGYYT